MTNIIIYENENNNVIFLTPSPEWVEEQLGKLTEKEVIDKLVRKDIPNVKTWYYIPKTSIGVSDGIYYDAWRIDKPNINKGKAIKIDMIKARDIQRDIIRKDRKNYFPDLDTQWMRAQESDDKPKLEEIKSKKQRLRDAPANPKLEAATTPEELTKLTLEELIKDPSPTPITPTPITPTPITPSPITPNTESEEE